MFANFKYLNKELQDELCEIIGKIIVPGKGIFVAHESPSSLTKSFAEIGLENNESNRVAYYELIYTVAPKITEFITSIVMEEDALNYRASNGKFFPEILKERNLMIGVKMYTSFTPMQRFENEFITEGFDNMIERCKKFKNDGYNFANWASLFKISKSTPSYECVIQNAEIIARYANICQSQRIVPMISTTVIQEGDHDLEQCQIVTEMILRMICNVLLNNRVFVEAVILRTNMVTPGLRCEKRYSAKDIALATITALRRTIPPAFPAIVFSSGCLTGENSATFLNEIIKTTLKKPWILSFAYSQSLIVPAKLVWEGKRENKCAAQIELLKYAQFYSIACRGEYLTSSMTLSFSMNES